jgi:hypothetical protein
MYSVVVVVVVVARRISKIFRFRLVHFNLLVVADVVVDVVNEVDVVDVVDVVVNVV